MRRLWLLLVISLLITACGKKGPLIYPDLLVPEAPTAVTLRQTGLGMKLAFVLPRKDLAGRSLADLAGVKVLKRETVPGQGVCDACADAFRPFKMLYVDMQDDSVRRYGTTMMVLDSDVTAARSYAYRVVPFMKQGVEGQASATVTAVMVQPPQPPVLTALPAPTEIVLQFEGSHAVTGTFLGYNLYRVVKGGSLPFLPLNKEPLPGNSYTDSVPDRRLAYWYAARTVVRIATGELVESILSNQVEVTLNNDD